MAVANKDLVNYLSPKITIFFVGCQYTGYLYMGNFGNSDDPNEKPQNVAFYQCLHCFLRQNQSSEKEL